MVDLFSLIDDEPKWGTIEEIERRNRIKLSIAAYSYEFENVSIMSDGDFDSLSKKINSNVLTGHELDRFFKEEFMPDTGMWIHNHPCLDGIKRLYMLNYFWKFN
jgi:hypothetical protein